jgi:superfamily II DNA or RNA helicase
VVSLSDLRLRAARACIGDVASVAAAPAELGTIRLRDDQRLAVARVMRALARDGGCLLADDVGRGKTYVALAIAGRWRHPLILIPASLRHGWLDAIQRSGVRCSIATHEALSRGHSPATPVDGIIVDESHRFRSTTANRYAVLARLSAHVPLLLLSATPLQNGTRDLAAQLALYLGSSAFRSTPAELARHVVRGADLADDRFPTVAPPCWIHPTGDDGAVLRAIMSLPPPAAPVDVGDAGVLRAIGLVRAWASSRAALAATLRRRRQVTTAIEQCTASGVAPRRSELRAWQGIGGDVQLAFAPLLVSRPLPEGDRREMLAALAAERLALESLEKALAATPDPDAARVAALRALRLRHPGERILAFSELASTVRAYFAAMRGDAEVGLLTASDARIASGRLPRDALLARFSPRAQGAAAPSRRERVTLLLSTDLLSEGVNLQDASVIVHLDLPWNPARLAQRVGRVRRPGGSEVVHSYLMAPPARTELLLRMESRLREKLGRAERTIGRTIDVLPTLAGPPPSPNGRDGGTHDTERSADASGVWAERLASWRRASPPRSTSRQPLVAATSGMHRGWLAALDDGGLLASFDAAAGDTGGTDDPAVLARAVAFTEGAGRPCAAAEIEAALADVEHCLARERLSEGCGVLARRAPLELALERRIGRALRRSLRHERSATISLAARLRLALRGSRSLGAESELASTLELHPDVATADRCWLESAVAIAERMPNRPTGNGARRLVALVILGTREP